MDDKVKVLVLYSMDSMFDVARYIEEHSEYTNAPEFYYLPTDPSATVFAMTFSSHHDDKDSMFAAAKNFYKKFGLNING